MTLNGAVLRTRPLPSQCTAQRSSELATARGAERHLAALGVCLRGGHARLVLLDQRGGESDQYESTPGWGLCFCKTCGTTLFGMHQGAVHGVTLGTVDGDPEGFKSRGTSSSGRRRHGITSAATRPSILSFPLSLVPPRQILGSTSDSLMQGCRRLSGYENLKDFGECRFMADSGTCGDAKVGAIRGGQRAVK